MGARRAGARAEGRLLPHPGAVALRPRAVPGVGPLARAIGALGGAALPARLGPARRPLEAAAFGKPAVVPRAGGFLDTVDEGVSGLFFEQPDPAAITAALAEMRATRWDAPRIREHAERFSRPRFIRRLREIVDDVARE